MILECWLVHSEICCFEICTVLNIDFSLPFGLFFKYNFLNIIKMKRFWIPVDQNNQNIAQIVVVFSGKMAGKALKSPF